MPMQFSCRGLFGCRLRVLFWVSLQDREGLQARGPYYLQMSFCVSFGVRRAYLEA